MRADFSLSILHHGQVSVITCSGDLDPAACGRLQESIEICLGTESSMIRLDGRGVSILSRDGIEVLRRLSEICDRDGIALELVLNRTARRVLDLKGLAWLGAVDGAGDRSHAFATAQATDPARPRSR